MRSPDDGPRSSWARYAFGWADEKPDWIDLAIVLGMLAFVLYNFWSMT
jgi:hypothetical protein